MENYGFVLMNREEATQFGFPNGGTGMFEGLYYDMMEAMNREPSSRYGSAQEMTEDEKFISFLNRYFIFRKVRHVAAEKITKVIEEKMPMSEASKCSDAAAMVAPVVYGSPGSIEEGEEVEETRHVNKIAQTFNKRAQIAEKEREEEEAKKKTPLQEEAKKPEQQHFIRPIGDTKITIRVYDPILENEPPAANIVEAVKPVEVTELPLEEGPAIQLVPKTVRVGKTIKVPKSAIKR
jgi:hypothetical protein